MLQIRNEEATVKAYIAARSAGTLSTHFVVVDSVHFNNLLQQGSIIPRRGGFVKFSTGKPVWIFSYETGLEPEGAFFCGLAGYNTAEAGK